MTGRSSSRPRAIFAQRVRPDFLVNNAGRGVYGDFVRETDLDAELRMIQLNVVSVVQLTKRFAREMVARGSGRIPITSSIAALAPTPKLDVYSATRRSTSPSPRRSRTSSRTRA